MTVKRIAEYINGNTLVTLFSDGTKIRYTKDNEFKPLFPESIDFKITNYCEVGCAMCHEKLTPEGRHGDVMNLEFINHLHAGTEMAIGGGSVTTHPDLIPFLKKLKSKGIMPSITIHQSEYKNNKELIHYLVDNKLIYGLGVSFLRRDDELWSELSNIPNVVIHVINGLITMNDLQYLSQYIPKILILGYKDFGRGSLLLEKTKHIIEKKKIETSDRLSEIYAMFKVVSFDNLAIDQLKLESSMTPDKWSEFYQGDDGSHTMYVDGVEEQFGMTSTAKTRFSILSTLDEMFGVITKGNN